MVPVVFIQLPQLQQEKAMSEFWSFALFFTMGYATGIFTIKYLLA